MNSSRKFAALALLLAQLAGCDQSDSAQDESAPSAGKQTDSQQPAETSPPAKPESAQPPVTAPPANPGGNEPPPVTAPPEVAPPPPINLEAIKAAGFATLFKGTWYGAYRFGAEYIVIRNAADWQAAWAGYAANRDPSPPLPQIDFSKYMLLGIAREGLGPCFHSAGIDKVEQSATELALHAWVIPPDRDAVCPAVEAAPAHLVLVPQSALPVKLIERPKPAFGIAWAGWPELQAAPYLEQAKPAVSAGSSAACTQLVVPFAVRISDVSPFGEKVFPPQLKVNAVAVMQRSATRWLQPSVAGETGIAQRWITDSDWLHDAPAGSAGARLEPVLRGVARACVAPELRATDGVYNKVDVAISVAAGDRQQELHHYGVPLLPAK